jgi:hypothetical protein
MTTGPPWVLNERVLEVELPRDEAVEITRPPAEPVEVRWPPCRVIHPPPAPPAPDVIWLPVLPRGPMPLPKGHPLRSMWSPPPRAPRPPA